MDNLYIPKDLLISPPLFVTELKFTKVGKDTYKLNISVNDIEDFYINIPRNILTDILPILLCNIEEDCDFILRDKEGNEIKFFANEPKLIIKYKKHCPLEIYLDDEMKRSVCKYHQLKTTISESEVN